MKVYSMTSPRTGNAVANQFEIYDTDKRYFQSYNSVICLIQSNEKTQLDRKYWDYSRTTTKYLCQFLRETKKEIVAKIKSGEYVLTNLN